MYVVLLLFGRPKIAGFVFCGVCMVWFAAKQAHASQRYRRSRDFFNPLI